MSGSTANEDVLREFSDQAALKADKDFIVGQLRDIYKEYLKVADLKISISGKTSTKAILDESRQLDGVMKGLTKTANTLLDTSVKLEQSRDRDARKMAQQRVEATEYNSQLKLQAQLQNAVVGSLEYAKLKVKDLQYQREILNVTTEKGLKKQLELDQQISTLEDFIGKNSYRREKVTEEPPSSPAPAPANKDIPFTTNLKDLEEERIRTLNATGDAVSDLDEKTTAAELSAIEWGKTMKENEQTLNENKVAVSQLSEAEQARVAALDETIRKLIDVRSALKGNSDAQKQLLKDVVSGATGPDEYRDKMAKLIETEFSLKRQQSDLSKGLKESTKDALGLTDAYVILDRQYKEAAKSAQALGAEAKIDPSLAGKAEEAAAKAKLLGDQLKDIDATVGKTGRNVGNYAEAFEKPFQILKQTLDEVKAKISSGSFSGKELQELQKQEVILNEVTKSISVSFTDAKSAAASYSQVANTLTKTFGAGSPVVQSFGAEVEKVKRSFGEGQSVAGPFREAITFIQNELAKTRQELSNINETDPGFAEKSTKADFFQKVLLNLDRTFRTTRSEVYAFTDANSALGKRFGINSQIFQDFTEIIATGANRVRDAQKVLAFQANDTKYLDGVVQSVNSVVAAYGVWQAAAALTGDDNAELQKTMVKLQAIMTIVMSLQQIYTALQTKSAAVQTILAARTALLNGVERAQVAIKEALTVATVQQVSATEAQVVVQGEAVLATEAQAVSSAETTGALEVQTVATVEAAVATRALSTVLLASGIGAAILLIGAAAVYVTSKFGNYTDEMGLNIEEQTKYQEALGASYQAMEKLNEAINDNNSFVVNNTANELSAAEKIGNSQDKLYEKKKAINDLNKQIAQERLDKALNDADVAIVDNSLNKTQKLAKVIAQNQFERERASKAIIVLEKDIANLREAGETNEADKTEKILQREKAKLTAAENALTYFQGAVQAKNKINKDSDDDETVNNKRVTDEERKLALDTAKAEVDINVDKNNRIIANDRSTLNEKISAIRNNAAEQRKAAAAENTAVQTDPTQSPQVKQEAAIKYANELIKITRSSGEQQLKTREEFRIRDLNALLEELRTKSDLITKYNDQIADSEAVSEEQRLIAAKRAAEARLEVLQATFKNTLQSAGISDPDIERIKKEGYFKIENKKITDEELKKLILKFNTDQQTWATDLNAKLIAIQKDYFQKDQDLREKNLREIRTYYDEKTNAALQTNTAKQVELDNAYIKRSIGEKEYLRLSKELERTSAKELLIIQKNSLAESLAQIKDAGGVKLQLEAELKEKEKILATSKDDKEKAAAAIRISIITEELKKITEVIDKESEMYKKLQEMIKNISKGNVGSFDAMKAEILGVLKDIQEYADKVFSVISGALGVSIDNQKNAIAEQEDERQRRNDQEIIEIEATATTAINTEQDKADKIAIIRARSDVQKRQSDKEQRLLDREKAKLDKEKALFDIAINTAKAVVADLGMPWKIAFDLAFGLSQAAIVSATPLPRFKGGLGKDYEGLGIVGDGYRAEVIARKSGEVEYTPATPTTTYIKKGDRIYADTDSFLTTLLRSANEDAAVKITVSSPAQAQSPDITKELRGIRQAIVEKRETHIFGTQGSVMSIIKSGSHWIKYIEDQTNW